MDTDEAAWLILEKSALPAMLRYGYGCYDGVARVRAVIGWRAMDHENLSPQSSDRRSHLFTVRVWREPAKRDRTEIRGKAQHVLTGEVHYFHDWAALGAFVATQMDTCEDDSAA